MSRYSQDRNSNLSYSTAGDIEMGERDRLLGARSNNNQISARYLQNIDPKSLYDRIANFSRETKQESFLRKHLPLADYLPDETLEWLNSFRFVRNYPMSLTIDVLWGLFLMAATVLYYEEGAVKSTEAEFTNPEYTEASRRSQHQNFLFETTLITPFILVALFSAIAIPVYIQDRNNREIHELAWLREIHLFLMDQDLFSPEAISADPNAVIDSLNTLYPKFQDMMSSLLDRSKRSDTPSPGHFAEACTFLIIGFQQYLLENQWLNEPATASIAFAADPNEAEFASTTDEKPVEREHAGSISSPTPLFETAQGAYEEDEEQWVRAADSRDDQTAQEPLSRSTLSVLLAAQADARNIKNTDSGGAIGNIVPELTRLEKLANELEHTCGIQPQLAASEDLPTAEERTNTLSSRVRGLIRQFNSDGLEGDYVVDQDFTKGTLSERVQKLKRALNFLKEHKGALEQVQPQVPTAAALHSPLPKPTASEERATDTPENNITPFLRKATPPRPASTIQEHETQALALPWIPLDLLKQLRYLMRIHNTSGKSGSRVLETLLNDDFMLSRPTEQRILLVSYLTEAWITQVDSLDRLSPRGKREQQRDAKTIAQLDLKDQLKLFQLLLASDETQHQAVAATLFWHDAFTTKSKLSLLQAYLTADINSEVKANRFLLPLFKSSTPAITTLFDHSPETAADILLAMANVDPELALLPEARDSSLSGSRSAQSELRGLLFSSSHGSPNIRASGTQGEASTSTANAATRYFSLYPDDLLKKSNESTTKAAYSDSLNPAAELARSLFWDPSLAPRTLSVICEKLVTEKMLEPIRQLFFSIETRQELSALFVRMTSSMSQVSGLRIMQALLRVSVPDAFALLLILGTYATRFSDIENYYKPFIEFVTRLCQDEHSDPTTRDQLSQELKRVCRRADIPKDHRDAIHKAIHYTTAALMVEVISNDTAVKTKQRNLTDLHTSLVDLAITSSCTPFRIIFETNAINEPTEAGLPSQFEKMSFLSVSLFKSANPSLPSGSALYLDMLQEMSPKENPNFDSPQAKSLFLKAILPFIYGRSLRKDLDSAGQALDLLWSKTDFSPLKYRLFETLEKGFREAGLNPSHEERMRLSTFYLTRAAESFIEGAFAGKEYFKAVPGSLRTLTLEQLQGCIKDENFLRLLQKAHKKHLVLPMRPDNADDSDVNPCLWRASTELKAALLYALYRLASRNDDYEDQLSSVGIQSNNVHSQFFARENLMKAALIRLFPENENTRYRAGQNPGEVAAKAIYDQLFNSACQPLHLLEDSAQPSDEEQGCLRGVFSGRF